MDVMEKKLLDLCVEIFEVPFDDVFFNLEEDFESASQMGECRFSNKDELIVVAIRRGMSIYRKAFALCHELVHVDQIREGRLMTTDAAALHVFDGEKVNIVEVAYRELPWEIEAFELQHVYMAHLLRNCDAELLNALLKDKQAILAAKDKK